MSYPESPTCHGKNGAGPFITRPFAWEVRKAEGPYGVNMRHCNYCGSLHPEDLLTALENGARLEGADRKYGWPHKFYAEGIVNPMAGEIVEMGGKSYMEDGVRKYDPFMQPAPQTLTKKFYNEHLADLAGTPEFNLVAEAIRKRTGIKFEMKDGRLHFATCQWDKKPEEIVADAP